MKIPPPVEGGTEYGKGAPDVLFGLLIMVLIGLGVGFVGVSIWALVRAFGGPSVMVGIAIVWVASLFLVLALAKLGRRFNP